MLKQMLHAANVLGYHNRVYFNLVMWPKCMSKSWQVLSQTRDSVFACTARLP